MSTQKYQPGNCWSGKHRKQLGKYWTFGSSWLKICPERNLESGAGGGKEDNVFVHNFNGLEKARLTIRRFTRLLSKKFYRAATND